ncbi:sigma-70 family RNA polymerase sigma factor [Nocardia asteroides NBRC 15531]|uniref:RNA polymerase sigma factor n=1 Tax=Nocardia asteroides NBRC 15531 TaxID=1110697 RepID=U5E8P1_NOCAS|nr:sigma-70 family RNA polymerase sigma factor [Nocardia asteroides]TLF62042.1 sigma-70 family RNA polymerase sigma factor [Nocardia asteroides NBRC 15531]UGT47416.1 sigma-70 family RNA polymerase sigma factor [Nocardia asteroides]SFN76329.1 RNA polymerase primary sigma factor/RNA polymerase nonessential primary-like sigma factor [Nocardia asteroides]VEG33687.1 RNA polymerase principal sigma factor hrdB [Nocardia asteroides]GAD81529.1 RNA polymerase major sigma factor [Nocardia asteroides NBRC
MTVTADSVRDYLTAIARTPLLTAEQEYALGARIAAGVAARAELDENATAGIEPSAERRAQLRRTEVDGLRAKDHMVRANLRLVVSIARRFPTTTGMSLLDLIQEGTLGLIRAVEKFDHTRGLKLSTYATYWIRQSIGRALTDQGRTIRLPSNVADVLHRVVRVRRELAHQLGRTATVEELAAAAELTVAQVEAMLRYEAEPVSLHAPIGEDTELGALLPDTAPAPGDVVADRMLRGYVDTALAALTERESAVIRLRFGLDRGEGRTLEEVGAALGLSRERARQLEAKALTKLRRPGCTRTLAGLLG